MFENYLCINGKKTELTNEQMRQLGIAPPEPVEGEIANEIARMSRISKAGEAADHYNVHDRIVVDGITFEIVGIGHDIDALTGKYNTITLRQIDHIKQSHINSIFCPDGFVDSYLDKSFINSPQSWIPESILPYVREVSKKYVTPDGKIKVRPRKLWLFSESEMFGSAIYSPAEDGQRYEAFATSKDRIVNNEDGSACYVWLRSARANSYSFFCMVTTSGSADRDIANHSYGVAVGFCV